MKIEKVTLDTIKRCYATSSIEFDGKRYFVYASEDPDVVCEMFAQDGSDKQVLWQHPGGCMSMIPIPNTNGEFLAIQEFYLKVSPSLSKVVWAKHDPTLGWIFKDILQLPYLHRFDLYEVEDTIYFIGATIAESKEDKEDWRKPGKIYIGELPTSFDEPLHVEVLYEGLYRNHGYWGSKENGRHVGYFGSDQGILRVVAPKSKHAGWSCETILDGKIGEIAVVDIDQDGELEIMTIEPFHGNAIHIYKRLEGMYQKVYTYPYPIDFAHTLVGCTLRGVPTFLAGVRRQDAQLIAFQYQDGKYIDIEIDRHVGPANLHVVTSSECDYILAANHTANEAAVYKVRK